jgi:hypothetical protein
LFCRKIWRKYLKNQNIGPRLGEFSPIGWLFRNFGQFIENGRSRPNFGATISHCNSYLCINFEKNWLSCVFGDFFTNSSSPPGYVSWKIESSQMTDNGMIIFGTVGTSMTQIEVIYNDIYLCRYADTQTDFQFTFSDNTYCFV